MSVKAKYQAVLDLGQQLGIRLFFALSFDPEHPIFLLMTI